MRWLNTTAVFALVVAACAAARLAPQVLPSAEAHSAERQPAPRRAAPTSQREPAHALRAEPTQTQAACPKEMAFIERSTRSFCIDRWEASLVRRDARGQQRAWPSNRAIEGFERELVAVSVANVKPQGYISGAQAASACANAGKRLCEIHEFARACRGKHAYAYPYGNQRQAGACNDHARPGEPHPVARLFERFAPPGTAREHMWSPAFMNDPRILEQPNTVSATGASPACVSENGVYDLVGNLHEWTADPEGTFVGGFFLDTVQNGEGCGYRTRAHDRSYHDYSTGFRCCNDPA